MFTLRRLHETDKDLVTALRQEQLPAQFPYEKNIAMFGWGPSDRKAEVYGLFHDGNLVSSARLEFLETVEKFELKLATSYSKVISDLPAASISRAVTKNEYQGFGFYSTVRSVCLLRAIHLGYHTMLATIRDDSAYKKLFLDQGYEFHDVVDKILDPKMVLIKLDLRKNTESLKKQLLKRLNEKSDLCWSMVTNDL